MKKKLNRSDFEQDKDYFDYLEIEKNLEECERLKDYFDFLEDEDPGVYGSLEINVDCE